MLNSAFSWQAFEAIARYMLETSPRALRDPSAWNSNDADRIHHFVESTKLIFESQWYRTDKRADFRFDDGGPIESSVKVPSLLELNSILLLVRQFTLNEPKAPPKKQTKTAEEANSFRAAVEAYERNVESSATGWADAAYEAFQQAMSVPIGLYGGLGLDTRELLDHFLYGAGLVHFDRPAKWTEFARLCHQHGARALSFSLQSGLHEPVNVCHLTGLVMARDLAAWRTAVPHVPVTRISFRSLA